MLSYLFTVPLADDNSDAFLRKKNFHIFQAFGLVWFDNFGIFIYDSNQANVVSNLNRGSINFTWFV